MPDSGRPALGVVVPALDAGRTLARTLRALDAGAAAFDLDVLVADGGSGDDTLAAARAGGARAIAAPRGRGSQLAAGAAAVRGDWLLFVHADTALAPEWATAAAAFVRRGGAGAGYFRLRLDDRARAARRIERLAAWRCRVLGLPYGDQGLLLPRALYEALGGYPDIPLMEDVHLVRRLGRRRLVALGADAVTSAARYRAGGYWRRPIRNILCVILYFLGVPPRTIGRFYA